MKFTLATIVAAFAVLSSAQDITQIPVRAMKCVADNFGWSGCQSPFDFVCICKAPVKWDQAVGCCVEQKCSSAEAEKTAEWKIATCKSVGINWIPPTLQGICL